MNQEQFTKLVERDHEMAERDPDGYRWRVIGLIVLGYLFVAGTFAFSLALVVGVVVLAFVIHLGALAFRLAVPFLGLAFLSAQSLWVEIPQPRGVPLERDEAPALFAVIEEIRARVAAPPLATVTMVHGLNAGVRTSSRLGLFGIRHHLLLGLSLMQALTPDQFRAVLAHEMGHLSRAHGRLGAFVHQARSMWGELQESTRVRQRWAQGMFRAFLGWYAPMFNAGTFVLARAHEFEADWLSSEATSRVIAAEALVRVALVQTLFDERIWPEIMKRAVDEPLPVSGVYEHNEDILCRPLDPGESERGLTRALARSTGLADTHPALVERLVALRVPRFTQVPAPGSPSESAAALLGEAQPRVRRELERMWKGAVLGQWEGIHRRVKATRARIAELDAKALVETLTPVERLDQVMLRYQFEGPLATRTRLEALWLEQPDDPPTQFWTGKIRLDCGDASGSELLIRALDWLPQDLLGPCQQIVAQMTALGRGADVAGLRKRVEHHLAVVDEGRMIRLDENLHEHGRPAEFLAALRAELTGIADEVQVAFLVQRRPPLDPEAVQLALGIRPRRAITAASQRERVERIQEWFRTTRVFGGQTTVLVILSRETWQLGRKFARVPNSQIFGED